MNDAGRRLMTNGKLVTASRLTPIRPSRMFSTVSAVFARLGALEPPDCGTGFTMNSGIRYVSKGRHICPSVAIVKKPERGHPAKGGDRGRPVRAQKGLKDRFPRIARVWTDEAYAGRLVEWAEKTDRSWTVQE